jgi:hypothetical protein
MADQIITYNFNDSTGKQEDIFGNPTKIVNWFVKLGDEKDRSKACLSPLPGSTKVIDVQPTSGNNCRGLYVCGTSPKTYGYRPSLIAVYGNCVYRINNNFVKTFIGNLSEQGNITFAESQEQGTVNSLCFICDGSDVYQFDMRSEDTVVSSTWHNIGKLPIVNGTTNEVAIPTTIDYYNYRLIMTCANTNQWYYSDINSTNLDNDHFYTSETSTDTTKRVYSCGGNLWVFSENTLERWTRTDDFDNPFACSFGNWFDVGLTSVQGVCKIDDTMYFVGKGQNANIGIYQANSNGIKRISTKRISNVLMSWKYPDNIKAVSFRFLNDTFIVFTSKYDKSTLIYCVESDSWSEGSTSNLGKQLYWDVSCVANCYNKMLFGSFDNYSLNEFSESGYDYKGYPVVRLWKSPIITSSQNLINVKEISIDVEVGKALTYTDDNKIWIEVSKDGGKSFSERRYMSIGNLGDYHKTLIARAFGVGRNIVIQIGGSPNVPITLYQLKIRMETLG